MLESCQSHLDDCYTCLGDLCGPPPLDFSFISHVLLDEVENIVEALDGQTEETIDLQSGEVEETIEAPDSNAKLEHHRMGDVC
jgi:hypothetical protein